MAKRPNGELSPLDDLENVGMVEVTPPEEQGMSVEDAYRLLAGMPPAPVDVEEAQ